MIRYAEQNDFELINQYDKHISKEELQNQISLKRVLVMFEKERFVGWMRFNLFWDNTPFMNMLYFLEGERGKGYGSEMVEFWEDEMRNLGYKAVLTSTQSDEQGQYFYRKHGYIDSGSLTLPGEPLEIIFYKKL